MRADLNIIDFEALSIRAPEMVFDLPGKLIRGPQAAPVAMAAE